MNPPLNTYAFPFTHVLNEDMLNVDKNIFGICVWGWPTETLSFICAVLCISTGRNSPQWARASSFSRLHDHTQTHHTRYDSSGRVISQTQRPLSDNTQQSQETDIDARRDPNPQSRQASGHRPTPQTARPLETALMHMTKICLNRVSMVTTWRTADRNCRI